MMFHVLFIALCENYSLNNTLEKLKLNLQLFDFDEQMNKFFSAFMSFSVQLFKTRLIILT